MPRMDGLTLIRSLRGIPQYKGVPILVLTTESGDDMKARQGRGRDAGSSTVRSQAAGRRRETVIG